MPRQDLMHRAIIFFEAGVKHKNFWTPEIKEEEGSSFSFFLFAIASVLQLLLNDILFRRTHFEVGFIYRIFKFQINISLFDKRKSVLNFFLAKVRICSFNVHNVLQIW